MAFCGKCGAQLEEGKQFCPACGAAIDDAAAPETKETTQTQAPKTEAEKVDIGAKLQDLNNTEDETSNFNQDDITQNKAMAILAYFGPLALIPLFAATKSPFARYHTNQGLVLFITEVIYSIIYGILSTIIISISYKLYFIVTIVGLISLVFFVLGVIGIVNAANGKAKALPIIGKFKLLK